jgi:hypothetical protein
LAAEDVIRLAERAQAAFPEILLVGFDIIREAASGKLEESAIGYVRDFHSSPAGNCGFSSEE